MSKQTSSGIALAALKTPSALGRIAFADADEQRMELHEPGGKNRVLLGKALPVDLIKTLKSHFEVSYAAVLYSALSGAIARVLRDSNLKVPEIFNCNISLPKPKHPGGMTNHVIIPTIELPMNIIEPTARLKLTQEKMVETTKTLLPILSTQFSLWMAALFPSFVLESCLTSLPFPHQVFSTIVPTTLGQMFYDGVELIDIIPVASCVATIGITAVFAGMNNQQNVSFSIDTACFPSLEAVEKIPEHLNEEIEMLARSMKKRI